MQATAVEPTRCVHPASGGASPVANCEARECAHNIEGVCFAGRVQIGDADGPLCDSFRLGDHPRPDASVFGRVASCATTACRRNRQGRCTAASVRVGCKWGIACLSYCPS